MFQSPGSILFDFNGFELHYYSLCICLAIACGTAASYFVTKKYYPYINADTFYDLTPTIVLCGILGARIYYVFLLLPYYLRHPAEIFMIWNGGLTIHGAIIGGVLAGLVMAKIKHLSFIENCDAAPWGVIVGQTIGRWGNFFNSEAFGQPCDMPFKLYIPPEKRPFGFADYEFFHPTFLYESLWNLFVLFLLFFVFRKVFKNVRGGVFFTYLILYSVGRILIERIRLDTVSYVWGIPLPTFVSFLTIIISGGILVYITKNADRFKTQV